MLKRKAVARVRVPSTIWKKILGDTLLELRLIPPRFSGRVIISFKEGGISFVEKTETMK